jgi:hypothetical protein
MITALLWALMQRVLVIPYRGCGTTFKGQEFKKGRVGRVAFQLRFAVLGIKLPTLRLLKLEDGTDRLFRNVGKEFPLLAA